MMYVDSVKCESVTFIILFKDVAENLLKESFLSVKRI